MSVSSAGSPLSASSSKAWKSERFQALTPDFSEALETHDTTAVKSFPSSALSKADPKTLPLLSQCSSLATLQGKTANSLLDFKPKSRPFLRRDG